MIASTKDPRANEPKLYLNDHQNPLKRAKFPLLSCELLKYHVHTATIIAY